VGFAVWALRDEDDDPGTEFRNGRRHSVVVTVGTAFLLAELGDKTMLATVALATQNDWFGTWLGATVGMLLAVAIAIVVGRVLGTRLPARLLQLGAAVLFAVFGTLLLIKAVAELT
jgi:putative Ca2+/H+ antiporter (TMEM165/GDT1 family)